MKKQFFGESGLTSTSANHICNLAKEAYEKLEAKLNSTSFIEETITVIGSMAETKVKLGSNELLTEAPTILKKICELKSLIAWFREAIKEKEGLFKECRNWNSDEYYVLLNTRPVCRPYKTEQDIIESWTVKEQEEYLSLETLCAVVGKYIHPNGALSRAKTELSQRINRPVSTECSGRDTIIRRYYASTSEDDVSKLFFSLQNEHRATQARLNGIKHKIEVALREDQAEKDSEHKKALEEYQVKLSEVMTNDNLLRKARLEEIEALKIVIPNDLRKIYEEIQSL